MFLLKDDLDVPEQCPLNGALWTSVSQNDGGPVIGYEAISDTFWKLSTTGDTWQRIYPAQLD